MAISQNEHDCKNELNSFNLRATSARLALMNLLKSSYKPLDVQTMIEYLKKKGIETDPATVFRIVNMFTQKGITKQISLNDGRNRYELSSKDDHHHLVCTQCDDIEDISDCNIDALEKEIEKKKQFKVSSHSLEFFGICKNCKNRKLDGGKLL